VAVADKELTIDLDAVDPKASLPQKMLQPEHAAKPDAPVVVEGEPKARPARQSREQSQSAELSPEAGLEKLKKQLEDEQKARIGAENARMAAEQRAQEAAEAERKAKTEVQTTQLDFLTNAIATATSNKAILKSEYAAALAAQDYEKAADVQSQMSENAARLIALEQGKKDLEKAPKPQLRQPTDLLHQVVAQLTPQSAAWVRAHPEWASSPQKYNELVKVHELVTARGLKPDTEEYFRAIERTLEISAPEHAGNGHGARRVEIADDDPTVDAAREVAPRRTAPPAAPVTRSGNGAGGRQNVVTLTPEQLEMAALNKQTPEEYARELLALRKEGRLN